MRTIPDGDRQPAFPLGRPVNRKQQQPAGEPKPVPGKPGHYVDANGQRSYRPPILG